ncbi:unnamed protein product [Gongylonema pulchrum]|uniref:Transposase n=1 Tax=Gongylonema pulchrum TaxID=637853 RepID=A0A183DAW0_9BILA|nr:unnamed protein product [Gongylonema pulchrum]
MSATQPKKRPRYAERIADVKPSLWVEFTALASECKAVNIGQVSDFIC